MRPWIISALVVGVVVAIVLATRGGRDEPPAAPPAPTRPPALAETEVQTYIEVMPKINAALQRIATAYATEAKTRGQRPEANFGSSEVFAGILREHHLSRREWETIRMRVERVVDGLRQEAAVADNLARIDGEIRNKEKFLNAAKGDMKERLAAEVAKLRDQRARYERATDLHESDRELMKRYFVPLDRIAPKQFRRDPAR